MKLTFLGTGWAESGEDLIHHNKSGNVAQAGKADVHTIVMPCLVDFDHCALPPEYCLTHESHVLLFN